MKTKKFDLDLKLEKLEDILEEKLEVMEVHISRRSNRRSVPFSLALGLLEEVYAD